MQRPQRLAAHHGSLGRVRRRPRLIGADGDKGVQLGPRLDPRQCGLDGLDGGNPAGGDFGGQRGGAHIGNVSHGGVLSHLSDRVRSWSGRH